MEELSGVIDKVVFSNEENGYSVVLIKSGNDAFHVVGSFPSLQLGEILVCKGSWQVHPKYGRQFAAQRAEVSEPNDVVGIRRYLESGAIRGIGRVHAKRIVDAFGLDTLQVLDEAPYRLLEIEGIGRKKLEGLKRSWSEQKAGRDVMVFLQGHGIGPAISRKIYKKYGEQSISVVRGNPYCLTYDVMGIGFKTADVIASKLGIAQDHPVRVEAGLEHVLQELSEDGHVCYPEVLIKEIATEKLCVEQHAINSALIALEQQERIIRKELDEQLFVWLRPLFFAEVGIAKHIKRLLRSESSLRAIKIPNAIAWVQEKLQLQFAEGQMGAIEASFDQKVHIITGGPGTGKSTITRAILAVYEKLTENIVLCAPTGKAAKRMSEITKKRAVTIHSLLEYDPNTRHFKRDAKNPLVCDLVIIDEASMIDTHLFFSLLRALPDGTRLICIGDIDQLPSVGAGSVLRDLIASKVIPVSRLTQIFRQGHDSRIVQNAHDINRGLFPNLTPCKDFIFIDAESPEELRERLVILVTQELPAQYHFDPMTQIQVLAPMRKGIIGVEQINLALQERLNPNPIAIHRMGQGYKVGDKVMQIKNNYTKHVYNGDVGFIDAIEEDGLRITFDGKSVEYDPNELHEITLAYAASVHKYQGSESPCIVMPVHTSHYMLLQRNLLYTGLTRAKQLVVILGTKQALALAIQNDKVETRYTGLIHALGPA